MIPFKGTVKNFIFLPKSDDSFCILVLDNNTRVKSYLPGVYKGFYLSGAGDVSENGRYKDTIIIKNVKIDLPNDIRHISFHRIQKPGSLDFLGFRVCGA